MNIEIDTVKIEMTKDEVLKLKNEIVSILNDNPMIDESTIRKNYPKVNELIKILECDLEKIPF